jgi:hypothetical protein
MKNILLLFVVFVLVSCSKDEAPTEEQIPQTYYRLVEIQGFSPDGIPNATHSYDYDTENNYRLSREITNNYIINYGYESNRMTSIYTVDYLVEIKYQGDLIIENTYNGLGDIVLFEYFYNSSDQVKSVISQQEGEPDCEWTFIYNNQGNVSSSSNSCDGSTTAYSYDSMKNPNRIIYPEAVSRANATGFNNLTSAIEEGNPFYLTTTYEYNFEQYPTVARSYFEGELINYQEYTYEVFEGV